MGVICRMLVFRLDSYIFFREISSAMPEIINYHELQYDLYLNFYVFFYLNEEVTLSSSHLFLHN